ncbi:MAG: Gfo/Idh/MocA family oxidoreductase [Candidatus Latescibacteria bacterium]|jgi:predicted dehydrogenase|nr:Gfo/Idh/MocA family oxidoreductase [Candidatus Latescibacterota bacterium]
MKTYRVAILGCRSRGSAAAQAYHAHPRTEVVGLCDLKPELLDALGDDLGVSDRFADLDEMIRQTEPDIVVVATGTEFHHDLSLRVLEHGVHIDVEKPICVDLEQADAVLGKADEKGVRVAVHHQGRVGNTFRALARSFRGGAIGTLRHVLASGKGYYGGYGLMNIGTHALNAMLELTGPCRRVTASALTDGHPVTPDDVVPSPSGMGTIAGEHITATLEFTGGVTATLLQHRFGVVDSAAYGIEVFGSGGRLFWRGGGAWLLPTPHFVPDQTDADWEDLDLALPEHFDPEGRANEADYAFADDYVCALDEDREHSCSGPAALHVLEILMGIFESAAYGRPVELPQSGRDHPLLRWRAEAGLGPPGEMPRPYGDWLAAEDSRLGRG